MKWEICRRGFVEMHLDLLQAKAGARINLGCTNYINHFKLLDN